MNIQNCKLVELPKITDPRGNLSFIETGSHINFDIKRVYYLFDVPEGSVRGGHAHKQLQQLIIAISGSFDITLDDGFSKKRVTLNNPSQGLYVCPMIWREIDSFSSDAICIVMASLKYDEEDYYRDYDTFISHVKKD